MTQRSILAGENQTIIVKVGVNVTVKGHDSDMVVVETKDTWGVSLERRNESEIGRARAAIGEHVLFDWRIKLPSLLRPSPIGRGEGSQGEIIEVQMGGSGEVLVPFSSNLKV